MKTFSFLTVLCGAYALADTYPTNFQSEKTDLLQVAYDKNRDLQDQCTLCPNGAAVVNSNTVVQTPQGNKTCATVDTGLKAMFNTTDASCSSAQAAFANTCCTSPCTLCPDGAAVVNSNTVVQTPNGTKTCAEVDYGLKAMFKTTDASCSSAQAAYAEACGCTPVDDDTPVICPGICSDGSTPEFSQRLVPFQLPDGSQVTCGIAHDLLKNFNATNPYCAGGAMAAAYCGCLNSNVTASCTPCPANKEMPNFSKTTPLGDITTCSDLALMAVILGENNATECAKFQEMGVSLCDCPTLLGTSPSKSPMKAVTRAPTKQPTKNLTSACALLEKSTLIYTSLGLVTALFSLGY